MSLGNGPGNVRAQPGGSAAIRGPIELSLPYWFGRYEILRTIGSGGMGVVYEARQPGLDRSVALKLTLRNGAEESSIALARFQREAQAAAALRHPNIVAIHEFGEHEGQPFFSMDLVEGVSLAALSRAGPIEVLRAARYTAILASAVAYAHSRNILHRDLKPANVLIDPFDQPKILDFGLAKRLDQHTELTCTGGPLGSPSYMAPEQLGNRHAVGPASDIYAVGAILYQLITGRAPFVGADIESTLLRVLDSDPPAPRLLNPAVPVDLESVCLKCLEKEPTARYASAQLLADDLERFIGGEPTRARPLNSAARTWRWCRRKPALATLAALSAFSVLALVIVTLVAGVRLAQKEAVLRQNFYVADMHLVAQAIEASSLGHARKLLEKWRVQKSRTLPLIGSAKSAGSVTDLRGWEWRYFWNQCRGGEIFSLEPHETGTSAVVFSPDGRQFVSGSFDGELRLWDLSLRRPIRSVRHGSSVNALTYMSDGRLLASASADHQVMLWDGNDLHMVGEPFLHSNNVVAVTFSLDGRQILTATQDRFTAWDIASHKKLAERTLPCWQRAAFSPDRTLIALGKPDGTVLLWSVFSGETIATLTGHSEFMLPVAFSPDGRLVVSGSFDFTAGLWEVFSHRHVTDLVGHKAIVGALAFSGDGQKLATVSNDQTLRLWDTHSWQPTGSPREHHSAIWSVSFSPDGKEVATGGKDGTIKFWSVDVPRTPPATLEIPPEFSHGPFSSDGRRMLTCDSEHRWSVWELNDAPAPRRLPIKGEQVIFANLARDPYALLVTENGDSTVWDQTGTHKIISIAGPLPSSISPDAKFVMGPDANSHFVVYDLAAERNILEIGVETNFWYHGEFSPDGHSIAVCSQQGSLLFWDSVERGAPRIVRGHKLRVGAIHFSPDGTLLASASTDGTVKLWDAHTTREIGAFASGADAFWSVTISPDNRRVAAGSGQGTIAIWDSTTREHLATLRGHTTGFIGTVAFTPDGDTLVSAAKDGVRFWRAASWSEVQAGSR